MSGSSSQTRPHSGLLPWIVRLGNPELSEDVRLSSSLGLEGRSGGQPQCWPCPSLHLCHSPVLPFANPTPSRESLPPEPQDVLPEAGTRGQVVVLGRPLVCDKFPGPTSDTV